MNLEGDWTLLGEWFFVFCHMVVEVTVFTHSASPWPEDIHSWGPSGFTFSMWPHLGTSGQLIWQIKDHRVHVPRETYKTVAWPLPSQP